MYFDKHSTQRPAAERRGFRLRRVMVLALFLCGFGTATCVGQTAGTRRVTVENGYGGGVYRAGDSVHVFARSYPADSVFQRWDVAAAGVRFADSLEWHTTFIMPDADVAVHAVFVDAAALKLSYEKIRGRDVLKEVWYTVPPQARGIIIACHGTNGSGRAWFTAEEAVQFTRDANAAGFAMLAIDAEEVTIGDQNGDGKRRWVNRVAQDNVDVSNIRIVLDSLTARGVLPQSAPLFVVGMSAGGSFAPTLGMQIGAKATATYCAEALRGIVAVTTIPHIWNNARWDDNEETDNSIAEENYRTLLSRHVPTEFTYHDRSPVFPERFLRIAGITPAMATALHTDLLNNGQLDSSLFLRMTVSDTLQERIQREPRSYPAIAAFTQSQLADVLDQIRSALANHQFFSDRNRATLRFFERFITTTHVAPFAPSRGFDLNYYPSPARSEVTISYVLPAPMPVRLSIIDAVGRELCITDNGEQMPGRHSVKWYSGSMSAGIYFVRIVSGSSEESIPMLVVD